MKKSTVLLGLLAGLSSWSQAAEQAIDIGSRKQLFLDDLFVTAARGVAWHVNSPVKSGPVITATKPWENGLLTDAATVIDENGKLRIWYTACAASGPELAIFKICYAESADGIHWEKPNLGIYEWQGSKDNNIIMDSSIENGGGVFLDPKAPPAQRYKLLARLAAKTVVAKGQDPQVNNAPNGPGLYIYTSPDGVHWTLNPTRVFPFSPDTVNIAFYDDRTDKYLAYVRTWNPLRRVGVVETDDIMKPWPYDKTVAPRLWPNRPKDNPAPGLEVPEAFGPDEGDAANVDFYTSGVVKYAWADRAYFMFPSSYRHFPDPPVGKFRNDGLVDIHFALSRDGRKFHRLSRLPYLGLGLEGSNESGSAYIGIGMVRRQNEIYQYYGGYPFTHGGYAGLKEIRNLGGIYLARQRLDGFVSVDADEHGGEFVTPAVKFEGHRLTLNLDASATGEVQVELRGADGSPIAGYAFADSDTLGKNDLAKVVTWRRGDAEVGKLAGTPVRIAFRLRVAKLYAFQFQN